MGLRSRLKGLLRRPAPRVGPGFDAARAAEWDELTEQVDAETKKLGAAVVGSWEVGAAELARVAIARADDKMLVERFSDALVPTLQPFQDLHHACLDAMSRGRSDGVRSGRLEDATRPLVAMVAGLGQRAEAGWAKTAKHLEPIVAACPNAAEARTRLERSGLRQACDEAERVLVAGLAQASEAPNLWTGVLGAVEAWREALARSLEIEVHARAVGLARDLAATPPTTSGSARHPPTG